jgi:hypothetical protein
MSHQLVFSSLKPVLIPLADVDAPLSDDLLGLQEFTAQQGATIIQEIASRTLPGNLRPHEQGIQEYLPLLFRDAVDALLQRYEDSRPPLAQGIHDAESAIPNSASLDSVYGSIDLEAQSNHGPPLLGESGEGLVTAGIGHDSLFFRIWRVLVYTR